jgi:transcriptional regulator with XRE-family HTH domain
MHGKMEVVETINKVFAHNLRALRGPRTQSEVAEAIGISLRGYQRLEAGILPRPGLRKKLVAVLNVRSETQLFVDPDLQNQGSVKDEKDQYLRELLVLLPALDQLKLRMILTEVKMALPELSEVQAKVLKKIQKP